MHGRRVFTHAFTTYDARRSLGERLAQETRPPFAGNYPANFMQALLRRDLFQIVADAGGLSEDAARPLFSQMLLCVRSLHDAGICHCDIGMESFVVGATDKFQLIHMHSSHQYPWDDVVGEFNRSIPPVPRFKCMNYLYVAPEKGCSFEADMWSLGVCLFAMMRNALPVYHHTSNAQLSAMFDDKLSQGLVDLVDGLLAIDPQQRLSAREAEKHPWMADGACVQPISRDLSDASTLSVSSSQQQQRHCVQCGTTETCRWNCQGTMCNACYQRAERRRHSRFSISSQQQKQQEVEEQLLAAGYSVERKPCGNREGFWFSIHSPGGHHFRSIKSAYKFYVE